MMKMQTNYTPSTGGYFLGNKLVRGVSLIEILVAIVILSIGLLGLARLQGNALKANHSAYMRAQASMMAHEMLDIIRVDRNSAAGGSYSGNFTIPPETNNQLANNELSRWVFYVTSRLPDSSADIEVTGAPGAEIVTISISWDDSRGEEPQENFVLRTRL